MIAGSSYVSGGEQAEYVLCGLGKLPELRFVSESITHGNNTSSRERQTLAQYGSPAGRSFSSDRRKMPCLKTSFDSEAPIATVAADQRVGDLI